MKKLHLFPALFVLLAISILSCERYPYSMVLNGYCRDGVYRAFKTYNTKTQKTTYLDSSIRQQLVFDRDTMRIVKNDSVIERLLLYKFSYWIGRMENGEAVFEGISKHQGRKYYRFSLEDIRLLAPDTQIVNLSPIMLNKYSPDVDTLWTFYKPEY